MCMHFLCGVVNEKVYANFKTILISNYGKRLAGLAMAKIIRAEYIFGA